MLLTEQMNKWMKEWKEWWAGVVISFYLKLYNWLKMALVIIVIVYCLIFPYVVHFGVVWQWLTYFQVSMLLLKILKDRDWDTERLIILSHFLISYTGQNWAMQSPGAKTSNWIFLMGGRDIIPRVISCCLPRWAFAGSASSRQSEIRLPQDAFPTLQEMPASKFLHSRFYHVSY